VVNPHIQIMVLILKEELMVMEVKVVLLKVQVEEEDFIQMHMG